MRALPWKAPGADVCHDPGKEGMAEQSNSVTKTAGEQTVFQHFPSTTYVQF